MNKKTGGIIAGIAVSACILFLVTASIITRFLTQDSHTESQLAEQKKPFIHTDPSARTGFLISERVMANFEHVGFQIAGSDDKDNVYRIDVYRYPDTEHPVPYRTDTFEEAVEFLEKLGGQ